MVAFLGIGTLLLAVAVWFVWLVPNQEAANVAEATSPPSTNNPTATARRELPLLDAFDDSYVPAIEGLPSEVRHVSAEAQDFTPVTPTGGPYEYGHSQYTMNLVRNGDFEGAMDEWLSHGTFSSIQANAEAMSGRHCLRLRAPFSGLVYQDVTSAIARFGAGMYEMGIASRCEGNSAKAKLQLIVQADETTVFTLDTPITRRWQFRQSQQQRIAWHGALQKAFVCVTAGNESETPVEIDQVFLRKDKDLSGFRSVYPNRNPMPMTFRALRNGKRKPEEVREYPFNHDFQYGGHMARLHELNRDTVLTNQDSWGMVSPKLWSGHYLYFAGTKITKNVAASRERTTLVVSDVEKIVKYYRGGDGPFGDAVLYRLDSRGRPDWDYSEHVRILSVDYTAGTVTVQRSGDHLVDHTEPRAFIAHQSVMAQHAGWFRGAPREWEINWSPEGPAKDGRNALRLYSDRFHDWTKRFPWASGLNFDVTGLIQGPVDIDNDLNADYGFDLETGTNLNLIGIHRFLTSLRKDLGHGLINLDGYVPFPELINGNQTEGFGTNSSTNICDFQRFLKWANYSSPLVTYNYPYTTGRTRSLHAELLARRGADRAGNQPENDYKARIGIAVGTLLEMPTTHVEERDHGLLPMFDEYVGGDLKRWGWLGRSVGPIHFGEVFDPSESLTNSDSGDWKLVIENGAKASLTRIGNELKVSITSMGTKPWDKSSVRLVYPSMGQPDFKKNTIYTTVFDSKATDWVQYRNERIEDVFWELQVSVGDRRDLFVAKHWESYQIEVRTRRHAGVTVHGVVQEF